MPHLFIYISHNTRIIGKSIIRSFNFDSDCMLICAYYAGAENIYILGSILQIMPECPPETTTSGLFAIIEGLKERFSLNRHDISLYCDANLSIPAGPAVTPTLINFITNIDPASVYLFTNTDLCRLDAENLTHGSTTQDNLSIDSNRHEIQIIDPNDVKNLLIQQAREINNKNTGSVKRPFESLNVFASLSSKARKPQLSQRIIDNEPHTDLHNQFQRDEEFLDTNHNQRVSASSYLCRLFSNLFRQTPPHIKVGIEPMSTIQISEHNTTIVRAAN